MWLLMRTLFSIIFKNLSNLFSIRVSFRSISAARWPPSVENNRGESSENEPDNVVVVTEVEALLLLVLVVNDDDASDEVDDLVRARVEKVVAALMASEKGRGGLVRRLAGGVCLYAR